MVPSDSAQQGKQRVFEYQSGASVYICWRSTAAAKHTMMIALIYYAKRPRKSLQQYTTLKCAWMRIMPRAFIAHLLYALQFGHIHISHHNTAPPVSLLYSPCTLSLPNFPKAFPYFSDVEQSLAFDAASVDKWILRTHVPVIRQVQCARHLAGCIRVFLIASTCSSLLWGMTPQFFFLSFL